MCKKDGYPIRGKMGKVHDIIHTFKFTKFKIRTQKNKVISLPLQNRQ